jgi:hypothetical protein
VIAAPEFLTVEDVEQLHDAQLRLFGGLDGMRDRRALDAAVAMPAASFDGEFLHVAGFSNSRSSSHELCAPYDASRQCTVTGRLLDQVPRWCLARRTQAPLS